MTGVFYEMRVLLHHVGLVRQTRSKDELAWQNSSAIFNQAGLYLVGLILRV